MAEAIFSEIINCIKSGKAKGVVRYVELALDAGESKDAILSSAVIVGMEEVIKSFSNGKIYIPDILIASRAFESAISSLSIPLHGSKKPKVILGGIRPNDDGLMHRIISNLLFALGISFLDIGQDATAEDFLDQAVQNDIQIMLVNTWSNPSWEVVRHININCHNHCERLVCLIQEKKMPKKIHVIEHYAFSKVDSPVIDNEFIEYLSLSRIDAIGDCVLESIELIDS